MSQSTRRPRQVNPSDPSDNGTPHDTDAPPGDAAAPSPEQLGNAAARFDLTDLDGNGKPEPTPEQPQPADTAPDPFDPAALRIGSDFNATVGLKKAILSIPVRKPDKSWWVRTHPGEDYRLQTAVIELRGDKGSGETYLVAPHLRADLAADPTFRPKLFVAAMNSRGDPFLWELNLPTGDRENDWTKTALEAAQMAAKGWIRVAANMGAGHYDVWQATGNLPEPQWPDLAFKDWLRLAFKDRYITALDHPVLRRLRGEVS